MRKGCLSEDGLSQDCLFQDYLSPIQVCLRLGYVFDKHSMQYLLTSRKDKFT